MGFSRRYLEQRRDCEQPNARVCSQRQMLPVRTGDQKPRVKNESAIRNVFSDAQSKFLRKSIGRVGNDLIRGAVDAVEEVPLGIKNDTAVEPWKAVDEVEI